jgi:hypothetical protein
MKVGRFLLSTMVLWITMASAGVGQESSPAIIKRIEPSVVSVLPYDKDGRTIKLGSGFFIGKEGDVITNRDLLKGADHADVKTRDGMLYPVRKVVAEDREANLIRVWAEIPPDAVRPAPLNVSLPRIGERVITVSGPSGPGRPISYGMVSAILEIPGFGEAIQVVTRLSSKFNGSPVINMKGEVIAIAAMTRGQSIDILPVQRVISLAPGEGKSISAWEAKGEESAEELYAAGLSLVWKEDYGQALLSFREAIRKDPRYANGYFQIGYCNAQLGRYSEAIEAYKQAVLIKPGFVLAHFFLGLTYLDLRDKNLAMSEYRILKDLDRDYANDLLNMIQ